MRHPVKGVAFLCFKGTLVGDVALLNRCWLKQLSWLQLGEKDIMRDARGFSVK